MSLSDLPREIILEIADHLDNAGTNALACTNGQVYDFLNKHLYRQDVVKPESKSLIWAAIEGVEGTLQCAIHAGQYLNPIPQSFQIALQVAARRGHVRPVELLLKVDGINLNFTGGSLGATPLGLAAKWGHNPIVELLLAADNINPNVGDQRSLTPLYWACKIGNVSAVRQLLARDDISFNAIRYDNTKFTTPLAMACMNGHVNVINLLLAKDGIDVNFHGGIDGNTTLMVAVRKGLVEVVESLLARDDLEPNVVNNNGHHVLETAADLGSVHIVKLLLDRPDIDPNFVARGGRTALMRAVDPDVVHHLLDHKGIEVNQQDHLGRTALYMAARYSNLEVAKLLLEREDIDINLPDNRGWTPLLWACVNSTQELVDLFLEKADIDPNPRDIDSGRTPLAYVCHRLGNRAVAIVSSLLSHPGTDPNAIDNNGVSILADVTKRWRYPSDADNGICADSRRQMYHDINSLLCAAGARVETEAHSNSEDELDFL